MSVTPLVCLVASSYIDLELCNLEFTFFYCKWSHGHNEVLSCLLSVPGKIYCEQRIQGNAALCAARPKAKLLEAALGFLVCTQTETETLALAEDTSATTAPPGGSLGRGPHTLNSASGLPRRDDYSM